MATDTKQAHTPGPWSAIQGYDDKPGNRRIVVDASGYRVAKCRDAETAAQIVSEHNAALAKAGVQS